MTDLQILAQAVAVQRRYPDLTPLDFRVLGAIQEAGELPLAYVRTVPEFLGTQTAFRPSIERLLAAGLITRDTVSYQATAYKGKAGRAPRQEIVFKVKTQPEYVL